MVDESDYVPWGPARKPETHRELREKPVRYANGYWGPEAREIIKNAGLKEEYKHLLEGTDYPEWRTNFMETAKKSVYVSKEFIEVEAKNYMPGGEGVGYHKNKAGTEPVLFKQMALTVIGSTSHGEWMNYEVEIPKTGDYLFELYYSLAYDGTEPNYSDATKASVDVDVEIVCDSLALDSTSSWTIYKGLDLAKIHLKEGKHVVKVQFVDGGFSYSKFRLIEDKPAMNEPEFDDGIMFKPE